MRVRPSVLLLGLLQSPSSSAFLQQGPSERRIHIVSPLADHSEEPSTQAHHTLDNRMLINVLESPSSLVANGSSSSSKNNNNNSNELQPRIRVPQPPAPRRPRLKNTDVALLRKQTTALLENVEPKRKLKKTFHYLMDAWAFSQQDDAVEQASKLLQIMETSHATLPEIRPDVRSYTKFINVVARSSAGSDLAGRRADQVLAKMKTRGVTDALLRPNTYTYQACLESHAHTGSPESARRARELCQEMVQYYKEGHEDIRPTARAWTAAITACGKAILATEPHHDKIYLATEAQAILDQLLELSNHDSQLEAPNSYNYNALITAWANAGETSRAEQVLEKMEARFEKGNMNAQPTTVSYNAVIDAYAKAGDAFKAEELLRHMEDLYEGGAQNLRPNVR
jgi:pentatricopeptide repeat protein